MSTKTITTKKTTAIVALQALLIIILFWMLIFYGQDEYNAMIGETEEEIETPNLVSTDNGATVVTLNALTQLQSGIATSSIQSSSHLTTLNSLGIVVNLQPLLELRTRYLEARAEAAVQAAAVETSTQEYERLKLLNQDERNVSERAVALARSALKSEQARQLAAERTALNLRDSMRQQWGERLASAATQDTPDSFLRRLLEHQDALIQVTLPYEAPAPQLRSTISVSPTSAPNRSLRAEFISPAAVIDTGMPGKTYYYRTAAQELRAGMRVTVRMQQQNAQLSGVVVPHAAVVWYGGKAWVYKQQSAERFVRVLIDTDAQASDGWFVSDGLQAGDRLVTSGVQLLLSEEFKYQIKNENED